MPGPTLQVEPVQLAALRSVDVAARAVGAEWFVAGATARDWLLQGLYRIDTLRATKDVDFGIAVRDWETFRQVREAISNGGEFVPDSRAAHRLNHGQVHGFHIDLVPFGPLAGVEGEIAWPPDRAMVMDVTGFEEAFSSAIRIALEDSFSVRVASLPALALMKFIAWRDRRHEVLHKDAWDLRLLLACYEKAGNADRIFDEGVMAIEDFDASRAAARLLGRDVSALLRPHSRDALLSLLDAELATPDTSALVEQMAQARAEGRFGLAGLEEGLIATNTLNLLTRFRAGLDD